MTDREAFEAWYDAFNIKEMPEYQTIRDFSFAAWQAATAAKEAEIAALKAERDATMKDAERYRWLRDATPWTAISAFDMTRVAFRLKSKLSEEAEPDSGVELDAAIDAAIAKAEGGAA